MASLRDGDRGRAEMKEHVGGEVRPPYQLPRGKPPHQCPWCDGTGQYAAITLGHDDGRVSCWACEGTGDVRQETPQGTAQREASARALRPAPGR